MNGTNAFWTDVARWRHDVSVKTMRPLTRSILALLMCFGTGAVLSQIFGLPVQSWIPAGIVTSTVVAISVFRSSKKGHAN